MTTLRHNPALGVALFIPVLSVLVASTLLTFSIGAQRATVNAAAARSDLPLPPMSKTSWREPEVKAEVRIKAEVEVKVKVEPEAGSRRPVDQVPRPGVTP